MTTQSTARFRIISGVLQSLGGTNLASGFIVPNRDDTAALPSGGPQFSYEESPIATTDFEGGTTAPTDFNVNVSWPFALMYPTASQGEENRIKQLLKSGSITAEATLATGATGDGVAKTLAATNIGAGGLVEVGDIVKWAGIGFTEWLTVTVVATDLLTVAETFTSGSGNVIRGRRIKPGTTREYTPLEFGSLDASVYERFTDFVPSAWRWGFRNGQLGIRGAWEGACTGYAVQNSAYSSTPVTETVSPLFAPKTTTTIVRHGVTALSVMQMDAAVQCPLGATKLATQLAATDLVPGRISSSGSFTCFLDTETRLSLVNAGTSAALLCVFIDQNSKALVVRWPSVKLTTDVKQREQTFISEQIGWQSQRDTSVDTVGIRVFTFS